jgi:hypothetical protein
MSAMSQCPKCDAPVQEAQDWCIQCGAAQSAGRLARAPGWLTGAVVMAATALLVAGASVAAYAALSKHSPKKPPVTVASRLTTGATGTPLSPRTTTTPATPGGTTGSTTPTAPAGSPPPKIPTQTPTPSSKEQSANSLLFPSESKEKAAKSSKSKSEAAKKEGVKEGGGGEGSKGEEASKSGKAPEPILLDTNAASTYNPNGFPAAEFGDPSLTIDGESSTAWTAAVQATTAPGMAVGVVLDLKSAQKLGSVTVETSTPGIMVEAYGANGHALPATIADPSWKLLHGRRLLRKKDVTFKLQAKGAAYRFFLLWVVKAPAGSTPAKPGTVAISEIELFPRS